MLLVFNFADALDRMFTTKELQLWGTLTPGPLQGLRPPNPTSSPNLLGFGVWTLDAKC